MNTSPSFARTDPAPRDDTARLRSEMAELRADFRNELHAMEDRLRRFMVRFIVASHAIALVTLCLLMTAYAVALGR